MRAFLYNLLFVFFLVFTLQGCIDFKNLKSSYVSEDLKISEKQLIRLSNYLDGELYSFELKRNVFAYPMAFIISENGDKSIVLACEGIINECDNSVHIYQLIKRYEKKLNQDLKILALNKKVLSQKIKANVDGIKSKKIVKYDENIFYDLILVPAEDCGGDDC